MNGNPNEWCVAYHGIGRSCNNVPQATNLIIKGGFKAGGGQDKASDNDLRHPGQKVGRGVYCSPNPQVLDQYAGIATTNNGKKYKMGFMMRVKPDRIRQASRNKDYWVLDGTVNEMRPYRILVKEV